MFFYFSLTEWFFFFTIVSCIGGVFISFFDYLSEEDREVVERMDTCDHLFVKFNNGVIVNLGHTSDSYYDAPIVQCVHCGLTNKYEEEEEVDRRYALDTDYYHILNNRVFNRQFPYRKGRYFNESSLNLISKGVLKVPSPIFCDAVELYDTAKDIAGEEANNDQLFDLMVQLIEDEKKKKSGVQKIK